MDIRYVFPHPISEVQLDVDCASVLNTINSLSSDMTDEKSCWNCEVVTSFEKEDINRQLMIKHRDLIEQVQDLGREFCDSVGWHADDEQYVSQCWFNKYSNGNWQEQHHHGTHEFVAVLYLTPDLVPTTFINPSDYTFLLRYPSSRNENSDKYPCNQRRIEIRPQPGKIVFFPGYMYHTVPFADQSDGINYQQNRVTIAFNFSRNEDSSALKRLDEHNQK
jgi:hypothetical protein